MICCPSSVKACALRTTRLDNCGISTDPLDAMSRTVVKAFSLLSITPDLEAGDDLVMKNACGDICIRDKDCDRLKGFDLELTLCGVPFPQLEILLGVIPLDGANPGDIKGGVMPAQTDPCVEGRMLELWSKNAKNGTCDNPAIIGDEPPYVQWLLPKTDNWQISGALEFNNQILEITLKGYAEPNANWVPSLPGATFPAYDVGTGTWSDPPPPILPAGAVADTWTLADQTAIQGGGALAWQCVEELPAYLDCAYSPATP